jgi:protein TonB
MVAVPQPGFGSDEVARSHTLSSDPASPAPGPYPGFRFRRTIAASGAVSLALHAAAATLVLMTWSKNELGVLSEPTPAISLELVASPVLENAPVDVRETQAGAASSVAQEVGSDADSESKSISEVKPSESVAPEPPAETLPTPAPAALASVAAPSDTVIAGTAEAEDALPPPAAPEEKKSEPTPRRDEKLAEKPRKRAEKKPTETKTAKKTDEADAPTRKKGGAASRANASAAGASRASASAGSIAGYAARVRARVAGNKPSGRGAHGTPWVSFGVSSSGGLSYARLSRSSGNGALDQAALSAVRRSAPFPPPPAGVPPGRLTFTMPFYFK